MDLKDAPADEGVANGGIDRDVGAIAGRIDVRSVPDIDRAAVSVAAVNVSGPLPHVPGGTNTVANAGDHIARSQAADYHHQRVARADHAIWRAQIQRVSGLVLAAAVTSNWQCDDCRSWHRRWGWRRCRR